MHKHTQHSPIEAYLTHHSTLWVYNYDCFINVAILSP